MQLAPSLYNYKEMKMSTTDMQLLAGERGNVTMMELRKSPGDILLQAQMEGLK